MLTLSVRNFLFTCVTINSSKLKCKAAHHFYPVYPQNRQIEQIQTDINLMLLETLHSPLLPCGTLQWGGMALCTMCWTWLQRVNREPEWNRCWETSQLIQYPVQKVGIQWNKVPLILCMAKGLSANLWKESKNTGKIKTKQATFYQGVPFKGLYFVKCNDGDNLNDFGNYLKLL